MEPALKHYLGSRDGFAPYAFGSFFASTGRQSQAGEGDGCFVSTFNSGVVVHLYF